MRGEFNRQAIATLEKILQIVLLFASIFLAEKSFHSGSSQCYL
ncbi:hypothetical protein VC_2707 [Vibrio cholerae O1 biovar El Tor str. N16961]|uniref:Uncharacterized protein n=1 Tax=Vibrio cholerae serotype O1 (strain ATCC 39315 / El Tor Inaba N16961) TaxID=243277 RepID=Q9KNM5_VIBCH|nr:hypothetical protein VC_2707 [Vibrio cholerae O1 biovar El Tor str. N16961]